MPSFALIMGLVGQNSPLSTTTLRPKLSGQIQTEAGVFGVVFYPILAQTSAHLKHIPGQEPTTQKANVLDPQIFPLPAL